MTHVYNKIGKRKAGSQYHIGNIIKFYNCEEKCFECGSTTNLERHHKTELYLGGKDELTNLEILCRTCHRKKHGQTETTKPKKKPKELWEFA